MVWETITTPMRGAPRVTSEVLTAVTSMMVNRPQEVAADGDSQPAADRS